MVKKYSAIYSKESYFITIYFIIILGTGQKQKKFTLLLLDKCLILFLDSQKNRWVFEIIHN